jgi:hypothetical protein
VHTASYDVRFGKLTTEQCKGHRPRACCPEKIENHDSTVKETPNQHRAIATTRQYDNGNKT